MPLYDHLASRYHTNLPEHIRNYLRIERGLSDTVINKYQLGWNGSRITIPIFDRTGHVAFFKLAKHPADKSPGPKMMASFGGHAELYGWDRALEPVHQIVVCEGEFDRLALESRGFAAVTSTAGALTFRKEWAGALQAIPEIFVCFDRDAAGAAGARRASWFLPSAKMVVLPPEVGHGGDVTDFFVGLGRTIEDFDGLLAAAVPLPETEREIVENFPHKSPGAVKRNDIAALKASVRIEDWVGQFLTLTVQGGNFVSRCPFHDDHTPSFVVFPSTQTFHCFGCRAHGDVFTFLMRIKGINFAAACEIVRTTQHHDGQDIAA